MFNMIQKLMFKVKVCSLSVLCYLFMFRVTEYQLGYDVKIHLPYRKPAGTCVRRFGFMHMLGEVDGLLPIYFSSLDCFTASVGRLEQ